MALSLTSAPPGELQPIPVATHASTESEQAARIYDVLARLSIEDKAIGRSALMVRMRRLAMRHIRYCYEVV